MCVCARLVEQAFFFIAGACLSLCLVRIASVYFIAVACV